MVFYLNVHTHRFELEIRTRTAQLFFAVTALNCYSEKELSCSGPTRDQFESCLKEVEHFQTNRYKNINVRGIKGVSPLNHFIFILTQAIYDYFHLCLEVSLLQPKWVAQGE